MDASANSEHLGRMKAIYLKTAGAIALTASTALIIACVPSVDVPLLPASETVATAPAPAPTAAPAPQPAPAPLPAVQEQQYANYLDAPQTPGTWTYINNSRGRMAVFGTNPTRPVFFIRCTGPRVALVRDVAEFSDTPRTMTIKTETATRSLSAQSIPGGGPQAPISAAASLDPNDTFLDAMAITKGRFAVSVDGERTLYLPAWVEVTRVIEDCR
ncbi:hypothetical protein [Erythrobacter sp. F6033]|uniref:hypothetical protein n=1 Tax=Erythrobacter sp. F6033 TaxID=2926401 RepID=UPI001FF12961|nr:hypothetical protein [Erythrobacter sp. F6033]MCK0127966.1 hypothetical protein [Erythrobacter sp. F6033]